MNPMVTMEVDPELVKPIVETKIRDAILESLGGRDSLVEGVIDQIINQKVDCSGKVNGYSSENKYSWLEIVVTKQIREAVEVELKNQISDSTVAIRAALIKQISSKAGADTIAATLIAGLVGTFESNWRSTISVAITQNEKN